MFPSSFTNLPVTDAHAVRKERVGDAEIASSLTMLMGDWLDPSQAAISSGQSVPKEV